MYYSHTLGPVNIKYKVSCFYFQEGDPYIITHIVVPDQTGDNVSCTMTDNGYDHLVRVMERENLIQLGWIHVCIILLSTDIKK